MSFLQATLKRRSIYEGVDVAVLTHTLSSAMTWDFMKRVERGLELMRIETRGMLQQMGAATIKDLVPAMVRRV